MGYPVKTGVVQVSRREVTRLKSLGWGVGEQKAVFAAAQAGWMRWSP